MLVYLSGPITPVGDYTMEQNLAAAQEVFFELLSKGVNVLCPHLAAGYDADIPYERWMEYSFALIDVCTHMLMLPRWATSKGAQRERVYAQHIRDMPVLYSLHEVYDRKDQ